MFDLDAYLERIGLTGSPTLAELHRAHVTSIPFENLDPRRGIPVSLALPDLERKLVADRRGGYCFEHNLLLKGALEAMGAEVELFLARVRLGSPPGSAPTPRTHLVLRVSIDGVSWHADVGFGAGTLLEPVSFGPGEVHEQYGWRFHVVQDGAEHVLRTVRDQQWVDLYGFDAQPVPPIDVELSNWFTSTHPRSRFVTGLIVTAHHADGSRESLSDFPGQLALTNDSPTAKTSTQVEPGAVGELLATRFGLPGFELDAGGQLTFAG
jgi:N-hydroxyarylamine O-acetyltransferase